MIRVRARAKDVRQIGDLRDIPQANRPVNRGRRRRVGAPGVPRDEQGGAVGKDVVLAGGRRDAAEQQHHEERREAVEREVDSIDTMCVLAREGYKKACGRGATHTARVENKKDELGRRRGA